jgi:tetratricopeptide (TPR) repeat protein
LFKGIHQFPTNLSLWNKLSALLLEKENNTTLLSNLARNLNSHFCNQTPISKTSSTNYISILSQEEAIIRLNEFTKLSLQFGKFSPQISSISSLKSSLIAIQQSLRMNPMEIESWYLLAMVSYIFAIVDKKFASWRAAEKAIELALGKVVDDFAIGFLQIAWADTLLSYKNEKTKIALEHLLKFTKNEYFINNTPLLAVLYRQIAKTMQALQSKTEDVMLNYQKSIQANSFDCISWIELAFFTDSKFGLAAATKVFEQCVKLQENNPVELYLVLMQYANYLMQNRCFEEAVPIVSQALEIQPDSPTALFLRGNISLFISLI